MNIPSILSTICQKAIAAINNRNQEREIRSYIKHGCKPWSVGYDKFKARFLRDAINDPGLTDFFLEQSCLPRNYGQYLDERVVEYPWLISRITKDQGRLLDAGSALNHDYILEHEAFYNKEISIVTLEPEKQCFWDKRISYLFHDIRELPFSSDYFDEVVSISTIEHIGMNNAIYTNNEAFSEHKEYSFLDAVSELRRVVRPGGKVYITVPYGKYTDFSWYQQFDKQLIDKLIEHFSPTSLNETYFCYEDGGWTKNTKEYCEKFEGFNIHDTKYRNPDSKKDYDSDYAACSRAIAALELYK